MKRNAHTIALLLLTLLAAGNLRAQDPLTVAPDAYKLEFENDWVRVVRVRYGPRQTVPAHYHTERTAAYVYLNDGGPILFKHVGLSYTDVRRPPTKAGAFRVYRGLKEVHSVENPTDTPSEFLRVEFKTKPLDEDSLRGKFFREGYPHGVNIKNVQFENAQVRITRLVVGTGKKMSIKGKPSLLVALTPSELELRQPGRKRERQKLADGRQAFLDPKASVLIKPADDGHAELLSFDFKTMPFDDPGDRTESHQHKH